MNSFQQYIGIDYSGAKTPTARLPALQVYSTTTGLPERVFPPTDNKNRWNWTRQEIAEWLIALARTNVRFIAGIDHGFSFPFNYFTRYKFSTWQGFLEDFIAHWPTHLPNNHVDTIRKHGGQPPQRVGQSTEFRLTETWTSSAKSVFHFDVQGSVAKSTLSGLPWLLHIRQTVGDRIHFWPFDGWTIPEAKSVLAEVYPSIFRKRYSRPDLTNDQRDAHAVSRWLHDMDQRGFLTRYFDPPLSNEERATAELEGWILGIC